MEKIKNVFDWKPCQSDSSFLFSESLNVYKCYFLCVLNATRSVEVRSSDVIPHFVHEEAGNGVE